VPDRTWRTLTISHVIKFMVPTRMLFQKCVTDAEPQC
jgi:hypothetical protein